MSRVAGYRVGRIAGVVVLMLLLSGMVWSRPAIPVKGCVVIELNDPKALSDDARDGEEWQSGNAELDQWLYEVGALSLRQEYGTLLPSFRVLRYPAALSVESVLAGVEAFNFVKGAWENQAFYTSELIHHPDDPALPAQWHLEAINAPRGWALSQGNRDVVIGIIDSGINLNHPDLVESIWINPGEDLNGDGIWDPEVDADGVDNDDNGYVDDGIGWDWVNVSADGVLPGEDPGPPDNDPSDFGGHGTHCAGDAAATTDNGIGVASSGAGCRVAALRAGWSLPNGQGVVGLSEATSALAYAVDMGFSVISMSFGGSGGDPIYFQQGMEAAYNAGLILVAAAGNESSTTPSYPAAEPYVIAVASTNSSGNLSGFSNRGPWITISAPGSFILSTVNNGGYGAMSGTSMACPITAGAIASLRSMAPDWTLEDILLRFSLTATPMSDNGTGYGLLNLGGLLDPFVSFDSLGLWSPGGEWLMHDQPGELRLRYHKLDGFAGEVSVVLRTDNPRVHLTSDSLWIGDISGSMTGEWTVELLVDGDELNREDIFLEAHFRGEDAVSGTFDYWQPLRFKVGMGDVLLIDANQGGSGRIDAWYTDPIGRLGLAVDVTTRGAIVNLADRLEGYRAVILATGSRSTSPFAEGDIVTFAAWSAGGGKWLLSGQNLAEALLEESPEVLDTLFHVALTATHSNRLTARGIEGSSLGDEVYFVLAGDGGAWNQTSLDVLAALPGAEPLFVYTHDLPDELAGVRVQEEGRDIVFLGFGLEAVNDSLASSMTREAWFDRLFRAWGFELDLPENERTVGNGVPGAFSFKGVWPNPTNGTVMADFALSREGLVKVRISDMLGREVTAWERQASAGVNRLSWQMPDNLSSGIYLVSLHVGTEMQTRRVVLVK